MQEFHRPKKEFVITLGKWKPLRAQKLFMKGTKKYRFFLGGYGSGKTLALGVEMLRLCVANPNKQGMLVAPTYGILTRTTLPSFLKLIPKEAIKSLHKADKNILLKNGTRVWWGSSDNPEGLEGTNLSFFGIDEGAQVDERAWTILKGRLRVKCNRIGGIIVSTPDVGWMEDAILDADAQVFYSSSRENIYNDESFVASLERSYSKEDAERLIEGRFVKPQGVVYKDFSEENIKPFKWSPDKGALYCVVDFGIKYPAALWIAHVATENGFEDIIIDEYVQNDKTAKEFARDIAAINDANGYIITEYFGDSAGTHRRDDGKTSVIDFDNEGISVKTNRAWKDIKLGISVTKGRIKSVDGERRLFISQELWDRYSKYRRVERGICKDIRVYRYPDPGSTAIRRDLPDERKNVKSEHTCDCVRYYCMAMYRHASLVSGNFDHQQRAVEDNAWDAYGEEIIEGIEMEMDYGYITEHY